MDDFLSERTDAPVEASFGGEQQFFGGDESEQAGFDAAEHTHTQSSGFVFVAGDAPAQAVTSPATAAVPTPVAAGAVPAASAYAVDPNADGASPLIEFNKKFRALCEEKDAAEREARNGRKAAGKTALKKMLAERATTVQARKQKNREDEAAKARETAEGVHGEPWARVVAMVDVHGATSPAAAEGGKKKGDDHAAGDMSRQKDVLIAVKNQPPATQ